MTALAQLGTTPSGTSISILATLVELPFGQVFAIYTPKGGKLVGQLRCGLVNKDGKTVKSCPASAASLKAFGFAVVDGEVVALPSTKAVAVEQTAAPSPKVTRKSSKKTRKPSKKAQTLNVQSELYESIMDDAAKRQENCPSPTEKELAMKGKYGWNNFVGRASKQGFTMKQAGVTWRPLKAAWRAEHSPSEKVFKTPEPTVAAPKVSLAAPSPSGNDVEADRKALRAERKAEQKARRVQQEKAASLSERVKENAANIATIGDGVNAILAHLTAPK